MNKTVFCDFSFLKDFLKSCPKHSNIESEYDPVMSWRKMYIFLCKSKTYIDTTKANFVQEALSDESLRKFFKLCTNLNFYENGPFFDNTKSICTDINILHSVYFSSRNKIERAELSKVLGIIVLGKQEINCFEQLFCEKTIAIPKGNKYRAWDDLEFPQFAKTSNSLIIIDNYILKTDDIISLLNILLPDKLMDVFHLSVYTYKTDKHERDKCQSLIKRIKGLRDPKLIDIKLVICKVSQDVFHDRIIISNNMWIDCGGGFDLFNNNKAAKRTNLRFAFPFMMNPDKKSWENEAYIYLIKDLLTIEKTGVSHCLGVDYWGDESRNNRLLSYYKDRISKEEAN